MAAKEKPTNSNSTLVLQQFIDNNHPFDALNNIVPLILADLLLKTTHLLGYTNEWQVQLCDSLSKKSPSVLDECLKAYGIGEPTKLPSPKFYTASKAQTLKRIETWQQQGLVQNIKKPLPWSSALKRSLESTEIQYKKRLQQNYYFKTPLQWNKNDPIPIWGKSPTYLIVYGKQAETLVDTNAYVLHPERMYLAAEIMEEIWIFAESRLEFLRQHLNFQEERLSERFTGAKLLNAQVKHPLLDVYLPLIATPNLQLEEGSGTYPLTPSHVPAEYDLATKNNLTIPYYWEENGKLQKDSPWPAWTNISHDALAPQVLSNLGGQNLLLKSGETTQDFPFCQVSQTPVLYRPVAGDFLNLAQQDLSEKIQDTLRRTQWTPPGQIPILPKAFTQNSQIRLSRGENLETWTEQIGAPPHTKTNPKTISWLLMGAGKSQNLWLSAKLLNGAVATPPQNPQKIFRHGGVYQNSTDLNCPPEALRLWVACHAWGKNFRLSLANQNMAKTLHDKFKHTLDSLKQNLLDFQPNQNLIPLSQRAEVDQYLLQKLHTTLEQTQQHYENFAFHRAVQTLARFCRFLRKHYFTWSQDALQFSAPNHQERHSAQSSLWEASLALLPYLAPLLPQSVWACWQQLHSNHPQAPSLWQQDLKSFPSIPVSQSLKNKFKQILWVQNGVEHALAKSLRNKKITHPKQAQIRLSAIDQESDLQKFLQTQILHWFKYLGVSQVVIVYEIEKTTLVWKEKTTQNAQGRELAIEVLPAEGTPCHRCRIYSTTVGKHPTQPKLCERCAKASQILQWLKSRKHKKLKTRIEVV